MYAGQDDDVGIRLCRALRQRQRIADDVGDAVEDLRRLIIVREEDGVTLALQPVDRINQRRMDRPFEARYDPAYSFIQRLSGGGHVGCVGQSCACSHGNLGQSI